MWAGDAVTWGHMAKREREIHAQETAADKQPAAPSSGFMMPGFIEVRKITKVQKTAGGLYLPDEDPKLSMDRLMYAEVVSCGEFLSGKEDTHDGLPTCAIHKFPLPPGTIVEHRRVQPWERLFDNTQEIMTHDVTCFWLPGTAPSYFERDEKGKIVLARAV